MSSYACPVCSRPVTDPTTADLFNGLFVHRAACMNHPDAAERVLAVLHHSGPHVPPIGGVVVLSSERADEPMAIDNGRNGLIVAMRSGRVWSAVMPMLGEGAPRWEPCNTLPPLPGTQAAQEARDAADNALALDTAATAFLYEKMTHNDIAAICREHLVSLGQNPADGKWDSIIYRFARDYYSGKTKEQVVDAFAAHLHLSAARDPLWRPAR